MRRVFVLVWAFVLLAWPGAKALAFYDFVDNESGWIEWWETNREEYLYKNARHAAGAPAGATAAAEKALLAATAHEDRDVRAEAMLALARLGRGKERLVELTKDPDQRVRCRAWVGLGLLNAEDELLNRKDLDDVETLAVVTGLGLLDSASAAALKRLRDAVTEQRWGEINRMALWALRVHKKNEDRATFRNVLRSTTRPALATEAIIGLAAVGETRDIYPLAQLADLSPPALKLPVFSGSGLDAIDLKSKHSVVRLRAAALLALSKLPGVNPKGPADQDLIKTQNILSQLAFRHHGSTEERVGNNFVAATTAHYPGLATLALASHNGMSIAGEVLQMHWPVAISGHNNSVDELMDLPQRSYAAIAMGVYLGNGGAAVQVNPTGGLRNLRNRTLDIASLLRNGASSSTEPRHHRAACALALGLSRQKTNGDLLDYVARQIDPQKDQLVFGHVVLGLGLLGDERALERAAELLAPDPRKLKSPDKIDIKRLEESNLNGKLLQARKRSYGEAQPVSAMDDIMARRAALMGLAALGDPRAEPILRQQWGDDPWVTIESARAMGACGAHGAVGELAELLQDNATPPAIAALAARALGDVLEEARPSRLSRLVTGNFYAPRIEFPVLKSDEWLTRDQRFKEPGVQREFHGLGNPFLYWQLMSAKGKDVFAD
ncbi:MAG TPA: HEAT repeat domain-containing protein [Tepidisphaeraceae bacterium]|jgi:HEAT repeat protein